MDGAPKRISKVTIEQTDHEYGPLGGTGVELQIISIDPIVGCTPFREAVASHYNRLYRQGKASYSADNITACSGGRLALTR